MPARTRYPRTLRARLALWYAAVLAVFLGACAVGAWLWIARLTSAALDEELSEAAAAVAGSLRRELLERDTPDDEDAQQVVQELGFRDVAVAVLAMEKGRVYTAPHHRAAGPAAAATGPARVRGPALDARAVAGAGPHLEALLAPLPDSALPALDATAYRTIERGEAPLRVALQPVRVGRSGYVVAVARPLAARQRLLERVAVSFGIAIPVVLLLASAGGWWLARAGLQPVVAMSEQARRMGASTLHERLPVADPHDELGNLATTFNDLLRRLDDAFEQQRRFLADASHELRTPVAILGGEAEHALARQDREPEELRAALAIVRDETRRLKRIVDDLFLLARGDAGERPVMRTEVYLEEVAADAVRAVRTLADARGVAVQADGGETELACRGDEGLLRRLVLNLLENAVKYTPAGGYVTVATSRDGDVIAVEVRDTGPGIPPEAREHVFDRFYRAHRERAADSMSSANGAGLGLAIARWIADVHGGTLALAATGPSGTTFRFTVPVA